MGCRFGFVVRVAKSDRDPTFWGQVWAPSIGSRQKTALAQPINYSGRGILFHGECKTSQSSQIAPLKTTFQPRANR
jgi:hypothetical protein